MATDHKKILDTIIQWGLAHVESFNAVLETLEKDSQDPAIIIKTNQMLLMLNSVIKVLSPAFPYMKELAQSEGSNIPIELIDALASFSKQFESDLKAANQSQKETPATDTPPSNQS